MSPRARFSVSPAGTKSSGTLGSTRACIGTGFGDSLTGTSDVGATRQTFAVTAVTSDLLFRDSFA
jgi:hypothetical protein